MQLDLSPTATRLIGLIASAGGRPLVVGGSVRDALLRLPTDVSKDIDIEVYGLTRTELNLALQAEAANEQGSSFGVLAVTSDGESFDISLPRKDVQVGSGHRGFNVEIDPFLDEREAFSRRDFTIKAIGWDPATGQVIDHFGGRADLDAGLLRHTTSAFSEDPLRVLRGAQFAARFGMGMAPETIELSHSIRHRYSELAVERVWGEWRKLARRGTDISRAMTVLHETGWIEHYPELAETRGIEQDCAWHAEGDVFTHLGMSADIAALDAGMDRLAPSDREVVVLATLLHDLGKVTTTRHEDDGRITSSGHAQEGVASARSFLHRIGAPATVVDQVLPLVNEHMSHVNVAPTASVLRRLMRRLEPASVSLWVRVCDADGRGREPMKPFDKQAWLDKAQEVSTTLTAPRRLLTGDQLVARGWIPGPAFREIL